ncbi:hypothetical protein FE697_015265 [Mumia zhuanghuii]|uniref:DUF732 domain-containing protein n=2 Tax=Mumia TaxID=1546255 RepID=A0ABW1QR66_9ACTN|nr:MULTISPECIES: hypothetical protein [Mumia]KAA1422491.1 hypothetical protein FE697_015265 [Mumia zhuanghuii]
MSTPVEPVETQGKGERTVIYVAVVVIIVVAVVVALFVFESNRESRQAEEKADELIAAIEDAGRDAPDRDQIVRVLGTDGGATCENPNDALTRAVLLAQLANGASGPGARPVIADSRVVQGQLLIIEVYCPDELEEFQQFVDDLETDDVAGE